MDNAQLAVIYTDKAAAPLGHYSQAIRHNDTLYLATQLGIAPNSMDQKVGTIAEQTEQIINNVEHILTAAGSSLTQVIKVMIYIADIDFWPEVNAVYAKRFADHKPARGVIPCKTLHNGFQVAFDVIACVSC